MLKNYQRQSSSGFTLLEVLLVVAAIAILAGIVIFAINPGKQLAELRNGKRRADVNLIVNAMYQYQIDNVTMRWDNLLPVRDVDPAECASQIDSEISFCADPSCAQNFSFLTENQKYIVSGPIDPAGGIQGDGYSGYYVWLSTNNRITVCAPQAELGAIISVTK